ncbi:MAG: uroporphyrinogen decarboxylase [Pseudomonadota bacterium]
MKSEDKRLLRVLAGETLDPPPAWMMRQAGRYLPEYRATRAEAGSFLDLCYRPDLAAEVTLQPIRRYGFDAAILFADILLVPQALGADLWFVEGEGPRLSTITCAEDLARLKPVEAIHETLAPVYETVRILRAELPRETALIGFAGAPWTVATYMIAGQGTKDQGPARKLMYGEPETFDRLIDIVTEATIAYLLRQIEAGAEVVKIFDSWAGALPGRVFEKYATLPAKRIVDALRAAHPHVPVIGFPRQGGEKVPAFIETTGVSGCAIDTNVDPEWAARVLQPKTCVQGNLDPALLVTGGPMLERSVMALREVFAEGPYIFNLGHGITPDADPAHVSTMLEALRR